MSPFTITVILILGGLFASLSLLPAVFSQQDLEAIGLMQD